MLHRFKKYYYTLKNLQFIQIQYRIYYLIKRKIYEKIGTSVFTHYQRQYTKRKPQPTPDPIFNFCPRRYYPDDLKAVLSNQITFLNHSIQFGKTIDWHQEELNRGTRLWKLNLHYHEFLIDIAFEYQRTQDSRYLNYVLDTIQSWILQNPIGTPDYGKDNWNSYALSLRLVSWIKIYSLLQAVFPQRFKETFLEWLWIQAAFLHDNLELDILGNHLIKNWKALHFCHTFFQQKNYLKTANQLFEKHIRTQFTSKGHHEEFAPMYCGIILEDLIEVFLLNQDATLKKLILQQAQNLVFLTSQNEYLFFNDSVNYNGIVPQQLWKLFQKTFPNTHLRQNGIINVEDFVGFKNEKTHLLFDGAKVVGGTQPGHVLCDGLSFEYFRNGAKVFTNSGVYEYNPGQRRQYARSTAAHNTLQYGDLEQSEIWSSFRMSRKATVTVGVLTQKEDFLHAKGILKGFNFKNPVTHQRTLKAGSEVIEIQDVVKSHPSDTTTSNIYFHLTPNFHYKVVADKILIKKGKNSIASIQTNAVFDIQQTAFYPEFGKELKKETLRLKGILPEITVHTIIKFL